MARLRRDTAQQMHPSQHTSPTPRPLRIFATGTVFLTHTLFIPSYPLPGSASRAQAVQTSRGGASGHVLAMLAQLCATVPSAGDVEPMLVASLGSNTEAQRLRDALESSGVRTKYCKIWPGLGVPSAWVMHARDACDRTVINHNPLPDVSHEDFIALLGPVLAPENYVGYTSNQLQPPTGIVREQQSSSPVPIFPNTLAPSAPRPSTSTRPNSSSSHSTPVSPHAFRVPSQTPHSPAPFDWLHVEGRSIRTTAANVLGVDGLARERKWRSHCVISVDLGRRARDGAEVLVPHADVIFLCTTTFPPLSSSPTSPPTSTPALRAILLSLARHARPHALLVLNAGREGAALLSVPTREYFQSSSWSPPPRSSQAASHAHSNSAATTSNGTHTQDGVESDMSLASRDSAYNVDAGGEMNGQGSTHHRSSGESFHPFDDGDEGEDGDGQGEDGRHTPQPRRREPVVEEDVLDEEGAHAAFNHNNSNEDRKDGNVGDLGVRWRLDECLRFATEIAGRRAYANPAASSTSSMIGSAGEEMRRAGWFD
ncbi:hypothetical protein BKA83DRAFT_4253068 [Pisolithus microcarpus]|nr:hypothetical protein BKA83DRAFT_4253068 [Pisolithus microcarpus]